MSAGQERQIIRCAVLYIKTGYASVEAWTWAGTRKCRQLEGLCTQRSVNSAVHDMGEAEQLLPC